MSELKENGPEANAASDVDVKLSYLPPALRHRNFRYYFIGQSFSLVGTWMQATVLQWIAWEIWKKEDYLGTLAFVSQLPHLLIAPIAGALLDRFARHRVLMVTQSLAMVQALALTGLAVFGLWEFPYFLFLALMLGVINAVDMPCRQAFVVELVGREDLSNGIALNSFIFNVARIIGPLVATALLPVLGASRVFAINAASFLSILVVLFMIRPTVQARPPESGDYFQKILDAFAFVRSEAALSIPLMYVGIISFAGFSIQALLPAISDRLFDAGSSGYGMLVTAIGVGGVLGALTVMRINQSRIIVRLIPICGMCFGAGLILMSFQSSIYVALALMGPSGAAMMILPLCTNTYLQKHVPERMRGRVMSFYTMMLLGLVPFGSLVAGWIGRHIGLLEAVRHGAIWCIVGGILFLLRLRPIEESAHRLEAEHNKPMA